MLTVRFTLSVLVTVDTGKDTGGARVVTLNTVQVVIPCERESVQEG